jgi:predicted DNA-binding transcriptional regulator YafY
VARNAGLLRTYRVNQILALTTLEESFERAEGFDLAAYWERSVTDFLAGLHQGTATIRLSPAGRQRMRELMSSTVIRATDETAAAAGDGGWITAVVPVESADRAHADFLRLGDEVEVRDPPALRDRMRRTARSLSQMYQAPASELLCRA